MTPNCLMNNADSFFVCDSINPLCAWMFMNQLEYQYAVEETELMRENKACQAMIHYAGDTDWG